MDEEMRVYSSSLTWPGALSHDLIPCEAGFVFTDSWEGTVFSHPCKWAQEPENGHVQL